MYIYIYKRSVAAYAQPCQPSRIEGARRHGMAPDAATALPQFSQARRSRIGDSSLRGDPGDHSQAPSEQDVGRWVCLKMLG